MRKQISYQVIRMEKMITEEQLKKIRKYFVFNYDHLMALVFDLGKTNVKDLTYKEAENVIKRHPDWRLL